MALMNFAIMVVALVCQCCEVPEDVVMQRTWKRHGKLPIETWDDKDCNPLVTLSSAPKIINDQNRKRCMRLCHDNRFDVFIWRPTETIPCACSTRTECLKSLKQKQKHVVQYIRQQQTSLMGVGKMSMTTTGLGIIVNSADECQNDCLSKNHDAFNLQKNVKNDDTFKCTCVNQQSCKIGNHPGSFLHFMGDNIKIAEQKHAKTNPYQDKTHFINDMNQDKISSSQLASRSWAIKAKIKITPNFNKKLEMCYVYSGASAAKAFGEAVRLCVIRHEIGTEFGFSNGKQSIRTKYAGDLFQETSVIAVYVNSPEKRVHLFVDGKHLMNERIDTEFVGYLGETPGEDLLRTSNFIGEISQLEIFVGEGETILSVTPPPTSEPTSIPTATPTKRPTEEPTSEPTSIPTAMPTIQPTAPTPNPTIPQGALKKQYTQLSTECDTAKSIEESSKNWADCKSACDANGNCGGFIHDDKYNSPCRLKETCEGHPGSGNSFWKGPTYTEMPSKSICPNSARVKGFLSWIECKKACDAKLDCEGFSFHHKDKECRVSSLCTAGVLFSDEFKGYRKD